MNPPPPSEANILVVDDDPLNRDVLCRRLQRNGHRADAADSGASALAALRGNRYDLVLLDIMMPGMDGHQVLSALKHDEALNQIPVMMISALEDTETVVRCLSAGAEDYLTKPFNPHILHARVESALARKRLHDLEQRHLRDIERELEIGREIQHGFLPAALPQLPGWDIAARFRPARQVAGDFYDVFPIAGSGIAVIIADVCDKGVGAAMYMALFRSLLHASAIRGPAASADPASVVVAAMSLTNDYIATVHDSANMFATVFFGILDPDNGQLTYVNAGHDPPVVLGEGGIRVRLAPTAGALGLVGGAALRFETVQLAVGDTLFAYTDGVIDASGFDGPFGEEGLAGVLERPHPSTDALLDALAEAVDEHVTGIEPFDDITTVAIRRL